MGNSVSHCAEAEPEEPVEEPEPAAEAAEEEEVTETVEEEVEEEPAREIVVETERYDPRFPSTNQARHCYTRYNEFYRCKAEKGEEDPECKYYQKAYWSICPTEWLTKWNEQREAGTWPGKY